MSPEQCKGAGEVDNRSDIYSLGCVLFELLCGRGPFQAAGAGEILAAHIHVPPPPVSTLESTVPPGLEAIVACLLAKEPNHRYQLMEDVEAALEPFSQAPVAAPTPPPQFPTATPPPQYAGQTPPPQYADPSQTPPPRRTRSIPYPPRP